MFILYEIKCFFICIKNFTLTKTQFYRKWKISLRDDQHLAQCRRAKRCQSQNLNPGLPNPNSCCHLCTTQSLLCSFLPLKPPGTARADTVPGGSFIFLFQVTAYRWMVLEINTGPKAGTPQNPQGSWFTCA